MSRKKLGKHGKRSFNSKNKKSNSNLKRFIGKFPHLSKEIVGKYFFEFDAKESVGKLTELDFEMNFKEQYYNKFLRVRRIALEEEIEGEGVKIDGKVKVLCVLREKRGDLFSCGEDESLCHCVSEDFKMSKGIAVSFVSRFGQIDILQNQNKKVGDVAYLKYPSKFVFYMITKSRYFMIPSYENLFKSLKKMSEICENNKISELCMPRIACGLDRLNWSVVKEMIFEAFRKQKIEITCYYL